ncbi:MAG: transcription antitermination factor NusB [Fibromonadaceae bacterium]|jgi:N utilization substance protein B|nr:transcription antitermination factor NusB [Fibromonadaceae bacterium]
MPTVSRRPARVFALQLLYAMEITSEAPGYCLPGVLEGNPVDDSMQKFGMKLVDGILERREEFRNIFLEIIPDWSPERLSTVDKIILQIAMTEMLIADTPIKVILSEAVQIANKFSDEDSPPFVNGVLQNFAKLNGMLK